MENRAADIVNYVCMCVRILCRVVDCSMICVEVAMSALAEYGTFVECLSARGTEDID